MRRMIDCRCGEKWGANRKIVLTPFGVRVDLRVTRQSESNSSDKCHDYELPKHSATVIF